MDERAGRLFLRYFWRLVFGATGLVLGLLWATFGLVKTLLIVAMVILAWLLGKWMDEGRPDAGLFRALRRFMD